MSDALWLTVLVAVLAAWPASNAVINMLLYARLPRVKRIAGDGGGADDVVDADEDPRRADVTAKSPGLPAVSVLVPARNEAAGIEACVRAVLANEGVAFELIVLDDQSDDGTAAIVRRLAAEDDRMKLEKAPALPEGWCGKQHACHVLASLAVNPVLVFIDADVRLTSDALVRVSRAMATRRVGLLSGVPMQEMVTPMEQMLLPFIHTILLGYLPMLGMKLTCWPSFSAGCGQFFAADREAYRRAGGHAAIRSSLHDGIQLPRAFRRAGVKTDLFDATDIAHCRMYHDAREVWQGLSKNATEGMANPVGIWIWSVLLVGGHTVPLIVLCMLAWDGWLTPYAGWLAAALVSPYVMRTLQAIRFRQSVAWSLTHPVGALLLTAVQWYAFIRAWRGLGSAWKGRRYPAR